MSNDFYTPIIAWVALIIAIVALLNPHIVFEEKQFTVIVKDTGQREMFPYKNYGSISASCTQSARFVDNMENVTYEQYSYVRGKGVCELIYYKKVPILRWFKEE